MNPTKAKPPQRAPARRRPQLGFTPRAWISLFGSVVLVVVCVILADARAVVAQLRSIEPGWLAPAFVVHQLQVSLLGLRWSKMAHLLGIRLGWWVATSEYALSTLLNQVLPSGIAGDALRAARHGQRLEDAGVGRVVETMALDRASGQLCLWLVAFGVLPFTPVIEVLRGTQLMLTLGGASLLLLLGVYALPARNGALVAVQGFFRRAFAMLLTPRRALTHLPLSLALVGIAVTQWYIASRALGLGLDWRPIAILGPWLTIAASVPSFIGAWGVRESVAGVVFATAGLSVSAGVSVSVVYGAFALIASLPAVACLFWRAPAHGDAE